MSTNPSAVEGLTCPRCGGVVPIGEGQTIVRCPYCDMRSFVRGEQGVRHYQAPCKVNRDQAVAAYGQFISHHLAIAHDARRIGKVSETFLAYLPFWMFDAHGIGYALGQKKVGKDNYERREIKVATDLSWDGPACDVGEFALTGVPLTLEELQPYDDRSLHASGMVFEPVSAHADAQAAAEAEFGHELHKQTGGKLDRVSQEFTRTVRERSRLVWYPLWMVRFLYHGRAFPVVVDGVTGKVLYGKAPGSIVYRALTLVLGMALGALLVIDVPTLVLTNTSSSSSSRDNPACVALVVAVIGLGVMLTAYRRFRHGEHYELMTEWSRVNANTPLSIGGNIAQISNLPTEALKDLGSQILQIETRHDSRS